MPAGPGESHLVTLFADVHYYFSSPTAKPQHHRFSRGSYLYLFHNASEGRAKVEIANHAGSPDQDAFSGYFDAMSKMTYSHKQPTLFTVTLDTASIQTLEEWHIPSYNERNEQKYLYKINTLDIYTWTEKDAATLLGHLQTVLPAEKLDIKDAPAKAQTTVEHRDSMSPVVQQLEQTAIGAQFAPRATSTASAVSFPGPPTPATSAGAAASSPPAQPAPMAYNPAAPAAPEPIAYREKTPPPPDAGSGTGLSNAAKYESIPQPQYTNVPNTFGGSAQPSSGYAYFTGPGQQIRHPSISSFPGPPAQGSPLPPPGATGPSPQPYNPSFDPPPTQSQPSSPPPTQANFNRQSIMGGLPGQTQYANYQPQRAASFGPTAVASPGLPPTPGYAPSQQQPPTPSAPPSYSAGLPPPPPGQPSQQQQVFGYSNYNYSQPNQQQIPSQSYNPNAPYSGGIHEQAYRPTEAEAHAHGHKPAAPKREGSSETRQRLEGKAAQVEAGVGKFMKRLDKLW